MKFLALCLALCFFLAKPNHLYAHPHVWADYAVTVVFNDKGLEGFRVRWTFDEMFSEQIKDIAKLKGTTPTAGQVQRVKTELFDNLRHHNYFSQVWIDGQEFKVQFVRDFTFHFHNGRAVYEFFVPCTVLAIAAPKTLRFLTMDRELFVDFNWDKSGPVQVVNPGGLKVEQQLRAERAADFFGGLLSLEVLTVTFGKGS